MKQSHRQRYGYKEVSVTPEDWERLKEMAAVHKFQPAKFAGMILRHWIREPRELLLYPIEEGE